MELTTVDLVDRTGLCVERRGGRQQRKAKPDPPSSPPYPANCLAHDAAFERRRRMLDMWLSALGGDIQLQTCEQRTVGGALVAADAEQSHLVLSRLETPMGVYPNAKVRTSDLHFAELRGLWRLSCKLPPRPAWIDAPLTGVRRTAATAGSGDDARPSMDGDVDIKDPAADAAGTQADVAAPLEKYYVQRYMLFSKYDEGVRIDEEGWYSVTPEVLAQHIAERCRCDLVVDAFCGVGGNAIQFAFTCERVVAVDLDPTRLGLAKHNAAVYGVSDRIEWVHGDFLALAPTLAADVVFLSPPWGGPNYAAAQTFDVRTMMGGLDGVEILRAALLAAPNVAYFVPRNVDTRQMEHMAREAGCRLELERCRLNGHDKGIMAYFGFDDDAEES